MARAEVYVSGLKEVRAAIKRIDPDLAPELRDELKKVGEKVVVDAKARTPVGPARHGKKNRTGHPGLARKSIRVTSGGNTIYLVGGKARVPYFGWLDFGGVLLPTGLRKLRTLGNTYTGTGFKYRIAGKASGSGRRNTITRPFIKRGRILYAAIDANQEHIMRGGLAALDKTLARLDLD